MSIFKQPVFWVLTTFVGVMGIFYYLSQANERKRIADAKRIPQYETAEANPRIEIDESRAQPVKPIMDGEGVDYNRKPLPPERVSTQPVPQEDKSLPSLVLCSVAPTPTPAPTPTTPRSVQSWLPEGMFIPCVLLNSVDSSHGGVPIIGIVTENIYARNYGVSHLIIPAGSRLMSFAENGYIRDRVIAKGQWRCIYVNEGTSLDFEGMACDMEYDPSLNQYGLYDKSAGIRGKIIESDQFARLEGMLGVLVGTAVSSVPSVASSLLSRGNNNTNVSYQVPNTSPLIDEYIRLLINGHHTDINDTLYVQIPPCKGFWVLTLGIVDSGIRSVGARAQETEKPKALEEGVRNLLDPKHAKALLEATYKETENKGNDDETHPTAHFGQ